MIIIGCLIDVSVSIDDTIISIPDKVIELGRESFKTYLNGLNSVDIIIQGWDTSVYKKDCVSIEMDKECKRCNAYLYGC